MKDKFLLILRVLSLYMLGGLLLQTLMVDGLLADPVHKHNQDFVYMEP